MTRQPALNSSSTLYIGLMSGTSADGIDLALVDFASGKPQLRTSFYQQYDEQLRRQITALYQPGENELDRAFSLDVLLAKLFAQAVNALLKQEKLTSCDIAAIGNHGQTIRHRPSLEHPFTLQIGCNQTLATLTNIRVVGQFRHKDIALGGQGAPLVPAFHQTICSANHDDVFIVNIGGIANITYLPKNKSAAVLGFDTGPGNALLDEWFSEHNAGNFDRDGTWGKKGTVNAQLVKQLLSTRYFSERPPKSTGREVFNLAWLRQHLSQVTSLAPTDVQASLVALTATSISEAILRISQQGQVYLCGGGVHNSELVRQIKNQLPRFNVAPTSAIGIDSDALESIAFAWLAYCFDHNIASNIPAVTGASKQVTLGNSYTP